MVTKCSANVKKNLQLSQQQYIEISKGLLKHKPFDYAVERKETFNKILLSLGKQLTQIRLWEKNSLFLEEVEENKGKKFYAIQLDKVLKSHFEVISKFSEALYIFFNEETRAEDLFREFQGVKDTVDYMPFMKERSAEEFDSIKDFIKKEYSVSDEDAVEMIINQDTVWRNYEVKEQIPKRLSKEEFLLSIQIYYITTYQIIERWICDNFDELKVKLLADDFRGGLHSEDFIDLKYGNLKQDVILKIYDVVKDKDVQCSLEDFKTIFYPGDLKIRWLGSQGNLALLFKGDGINALKTYNINIFKAVAEKFLTKKNKVMNYKQLSVSYTKLMNTSKDKSEHIEKFLYKLFR